MRNSIIGQLLAGFIRLGYPGPEKGQDARYWESCPENDEVTYALVNVDREWNEVRDEADSDGDIPDEIDLATDAFSWDLDRNAPGNY